MEPSTSDTPSGCSSGCSMDILTDDALIIIFSFFSLYERITRMRVNKRWKRLLSNRQTWTHLDFWQEKKTNKYWKSGNIRYWSNLKVNTDSSVWVFPTATVALDDKAVLDLLNKYTSSSLKSLYLHVVSEEIMVHVKESYKNLETISFLSAHCPPRSATTRMLPSHDRCAHHIEHVLKRLPNIKVCELPLDAISSYSSIGKRQRKLLSCLRECGHLRRLTITGLEPRLLTPDSFEGLSKEITAVNFLNMAIVKPRGYSGGYCGNSGTVDSDPLCNSLQALLKMASMYTFRVSIKYKAYTNMYNIDKFLCAIADKWHGLKCLGLSGIKSPSETTFALLLTGISQLEQLELSDQLANDEHIALIAKHLKKLITLTITDGIYTSSGLKNLCDHPSIEKLGLVQRNQTRPNPGWLLAVYDVIRSLPKITSVRLMGHTLIKLHAREDIPSISPDIQMDIADVSLFANMVF